MQCPRTNCKNKALIDSVLGVLPCEVHQEADDKISKIERPAFYNLHKIHRIQQQRDDFAADILQPYAPGKDQKPNVDFLKTYPERAKDYFSDKQLKDL